ncbi:MAG: hypothetical protein J3K34DRAFT_401945 [Monoraphidium minutum]|nr:MAG: hypothetical protein J3K34DRAFT_401945 [Monoraphidium minutum]
MALQMKALPRLGAISAPKAMPRPGAIRSRSLNKVSALPVADLAAAEGLARALAPTAELFNTFGLPEPLIHWGHPGNMAVVLLAMGGYGSWLGWQIRLSDDGDLVAKAKDLHPKLLGGAFVFFALGASGGMLSLIMQGKPILESPHAVTGLTGLGLLALQAMLPLFFAEEPGARTAHAFFGTGIMGLLVIHMFLGIQLGLSI